VFALRCVEMMIVVIVLFGEKENSAKTKYSLRWPSQSGLPTLQTLGILGMVTIPLTC